ncbi:MAG TPA: bifunctional 2-polyprenyl-6-hydroxyphenol methylase/3-demethylubiquinol 3-O-methyltransferase UbiG [Steroidobacteraceae bacterium]|jgi:2-polyprenyl-6-hydroxyphenyl methylase/3-demethylubiquinone-9 3-methyltransferase
MSGDRTMDMGGSGAAANADSAELGKFDELAHRFWDPRGEFRPLHLLNPVRTQFVLERASLGGARALDVGCGGGLLSESLSRAGAHVTAIDLAPTMIEAAREHARQSALSIDYRLESAEALAAAEPQSFDVVTCMEMLEHVPDPAAMLGTLARLTRPGGHVFVSTLHRNLRSFLAAIVAAEYVLRLLPRGTHEYERFIRPSELARWGRAAGLALADIAGLKVDPFSGSCRASRDPSVNYIAHFVCAAPA